MLPALHGNASENLKTSAALHGNALRQNWCPKMTPPKTLQTIYFILFFAHFWRSTGAPTLCTPKNGSPQVDAKERPRRSLQTFIFKAFFANFILRAHLGGRPRRGLNFQNMQYRIGFIDVFDALIESMLDHQVATPKLKNERHAAWERFGKKRNERHAAWERFSSRHGPVEAPKGERRILENKAPERQNGKT